MTLIKKQLAKCISSSGETSLVEVELDTDSGESAIFVEHQYSKRFKLTEHDDAMKLYEELNGPGKCVDIGLIADIITHRKELSE